MQLAQAKLHSLEEIPSHRPWYGNLGYPYCIIVQINNLFPDKHRQWFTGLVKAIKEISRHCGFYTVIHETTSERAHILKTQRGGDTVAHLFPRENNGTRQKNNLKIVFICNNCRFLIFNFTTSFLLLLI